ncbi:Tn3 family transposase [Streptomyces sanglieri]|uniref:Tn3 family transposase n=1 Tax=Streptomyces sanglieri TaxID=193460 RepID=A0ABW2WN95_9ACTN
MSWAKLSEDRDGEVAVVRGDAEVVKAQLEPCSMITLNLPSNRRDEQEMFVLCLRILQSALVYVNTLMLQDVLGEPEWSDLLRLPTGAS